MYPPKFLIPFQLLWRATIAIHKVINTTVLFIPTIFKHGKSSFFRFLYQFRTIQTFTQVHDKPHGFNGMSRSYLTTFKTIHKITAYIYILNYDSTKFGTIKDVHYFMDTSIYRLFQIICS